MLPRGPKRGGIRETVGFEERKAERGKMGGGLGDGAWHGARWGGPMLTPARPTAFLAMCHCEPVTDVTGVAIRNPIPSAPFRQGRQAGYWWCAGGFIVYIRGGLW